MFESLANTLEWTLDNFDFNRPNLGINDILNGGYEVPFRNYYYENLLELESDTNWDSEFNYIDIVSFNEINQLSNIIELGHQINSLNNLGRMGMINKVFRDFVKNQELYPEIPYYSMSLFTHVNNVNYQENSNFISNFFTTLSNSFLFFADELNLFLNIDLGKVEFVLIGPLTVQNVHKYFSQHGNHHYYHNNLSINEGAAGGTQTRLSVLFNNAGLPPIPPLPL
jgi:hypothetical protein